MAEIRLIQTKGEKWQARIEDQTYNAGLISMEDFANLDGEKFQQLLDALNSIAGMAEEEAREYIGKAIKGELPQMTHDTLQKDVVTHDTRHVTHDPWGIDSDLLGKIATHPNLSRTELLKALNVSRKTLYRRLSPLLHKGLVEEEKDPDNWRLKHLMITDLGAKYLDKYGCKNKEAVD